MTKFATLLFALTFVAACNDAALQFGASNNRKAPDSSGDDDDDSATEPTMVAGAYLVCWSQSKGPKPDGSEDVGCRLEQYDTGEKIATDPASIAWEVESTTLRLANEISICAKTDSCHVILKNLTSRSSKSAIARSGGTSFKKDLAVLDEDPADRFSLQFYGPVEGVVDPKTAKANANAGYIAGGIESIFGTLTENSQSAASGLGTVLQASQIKGTNVDALCNTYPSTTATSLTQLDTKDTKRIAQNKKLCFIGTSTDMVKTDIGCGLLKIGSSATSTSTTPTYGVFKVGINPESGKPDRASISKIRELQSQFQCR